jgi:hypothetical protein
MRLKVSGLRRVVKRNLGIEFGREQLTSYGGLELVRQYFEIISLNRRIRHGFREHDLGGDYSCVHLVVLIVGLLVVGARRLKQLRYVAQFNSLRGRPMTRRTVHHVVAEAAKAVAIPFPVHPTCCATPRAFI